MLRKVLIGVGILLVLVIGGGFLLPDVVTVTRSTTIQAPPEAIYPMIATPRQ